MGEKARISTRVRTAFAVGIVLIIGLGAGAFVLDWTKARATSVDELKTLDTAETELAGVEIVEVASAPRFTTACNIGGDPSQYAEGELCCVTYRRCWAGDYPDCNLMIQNTRCAGGVFSASCRCHCDENGDCAGWCVSHTACEADEELKTCVASTAQILYCSENNAVLH